MMRNTFGSQAGLRRNRRSDRVRLIRIEGFSFGARIKNIYLAHSSWVRPAFCRCGLAAIAYALLTEHF